MKITNYYIFILLLMNTALLSAQEYVNTSLLDSFICNYGCMKEKKDSQYYLVRFDKTQPLEIEPARILAPGIGIVSLRSADKKNSEKNKGFTVVQAVHDGWKLSPSNHWKSKTNKRNTYTVTGTPRTDIFRHLSKSKGVELLFYDTLSNSCVISCKEKLFFKKILSMHDLIFADLYRKGTTEIEIIGYRRNVSGVNLTDFKIPNANAHNIVVGVKEENISADDIDLKHRQKASPISSAKETIHATTIACLIGGAGNTFYKSRGIANRCTFFSSSFSNLFADPASVLNQEKITVQNHSYGTIIQQFYGAEAVSYDAQTFQNKNIVHVFSSGNKGLDGASEGKYATIPGFANLTANFKMAKNIICVGAANENYTLNPFSSSGPAYDGRMVPQLVTLGANGTSEAAAIVSGTSAVLQQVYADSNQQVIPRASLVKAILYNTANDIGKPGIDYQSGFGIINAYEAIKAMQQKQFDSGTVSQGEVWKKNILLPPSTGQLKITLCWTDTVSAINNTKALVNDLDLEVMESATGSIFHPWVLSTFPHKDSLQLPATRKRDSLNTAEQVSIELPAAGNYEIRVKGVQASGSPVEFHIAYSQEAINQFYFQNPVHSADVQPYEVDSLDIRWKVLLSDTSQTGNLSISYDGGGSWELLKENHPLQVNSYVWAIKDTSSQAVIKMETPFGRFLSEPFIIHDITRIKADYVCTDSFRLSWPKHLYADSYKIYALYDSAYVTHIITQTDTFKVFKKAQYSSVLYAIEPILRNDIKAARSALYDINQLGVKCYYETINYAHVGNEKIELILDLNFTEDIEKIFFTRQTGNTLPISLDSQLVAANTYSYYSTALPLVKGVNVFQARIVLKNGAVINTERVNIVGSGENQIHFYPNPVPKNSQLNYVLQTPEQQSNYTLKLFDITGRLLHTIPLGTNNTISTSEMPKGVIVYQLINNKNQVVLETGKLLIQ